MHSDSGLERAVLACICQNGANAYFDIADMLGPSTFTVDSNQAIFKCVKDLLEENQDTKLDPISIYSKSKSLGFGEYLNSKTERDHLKALFQLPVRGENVSRFAAKIRKLEVARELYNKVEEIRQSLEGYQGDENLDYLVNLVEQPIFDFTGMLNSGDNNEPELIGKGVKEWLENLANNPRTLVGISSGYPLYDFAIGGGFRRGSVNLIGARTKAGKSMLAVNIAYNISKNIGIPVLYLDTEMDRVDNLPRILARISQVTINDIELGQFAKNPETRRKVFKAAEELEKDGFYYMKIAGKPFEETVSLMRRWLMKKVGYDENGKIKDCLIIYDYIKLMSEEGLSSALQEYQKLGFMMTSLHNFAARYEIPLLTFAQLNRDGITKESTDAVSGSDRLIWLCTNFSIYKFKSDEEIAEDGPEHGNRKLIPVVARHGEGLQDGDYINMFMRGKYGEIKEGSTKSGLKGKNKNQPDSFVVDDADLSTDIPFDDSETN